MLLPVRDRLSRVFEQPPDYVRREVPRLPRSAAFCQRSFSWKPPRLTVNPQLSVRQENQMQQPGESQLRSQSQLPEPCDQYHYVFGSEGCWEPVSLGPLSSDIPAPGRFSVMSWNIDFMRPLPDERMKAALEYLKASDLREGKPTIIMLNEMLATDLYLIQNEDWVQQHYYLTDLTGESWIHSYGGLRQTYSGVHD